MTGEVVDLFAGPGGWDCGARDLGIDPLGIEIDPYATATRARNGLRTLVADLSRLDPADFPDPIEGLIASPPCPAFSAAGTRDGVDWLPHLCDVARGELLEVDPAAPPEAALSLVPLRWVLHHRPRWVAWEQVPPVLPLWEACADRLAAEGYHTWAGVLSAEEYGVPQVRRRAVMMASLDRVVHPPPPTHAAYRKGCPPDTDGGRLLPWVTMGEALGWGKTTGPARAIMATSSGGPRLLDGGSGARAQIAREIANGEWLLNTGRDWKPGGDRDDAQTVAPDQPSPAVTGKAVGQWQWRLRAASTSNATIRNADEPAPTILANYAKQGGWVWERPATTVAGDTRIWPPGHKVNQADRDRLGDDEANGRYGDRAGTDAIRVTPEEAAILQGFTADHEFVGRLEVDGQESMFPDLEPVGAVSHRARQIGNAVPPPMARAVLAALTQGE